MRGHTVSGLSMRIIFTISSSAKQKLNTRRSTETEFVEVDGCIPAVLLTRYWLDDQGYYVFVNIVFQYEKNSIILENNVKALRSKSMKHIIIRYYFVTYCIDKYELSV